MDPWEIERLHGNMVRLIPSRICISLNRALHLVIRNNPKLRRLVLDTGPRCITCEAKEARKAGHPRKTLREDVTIACHQNRCTQVRYCSLECRVADWRWHKHECSAPESRHGLLLGTKLSASGLPRGETSNWLAGRINLNARLEYAMRWVEDRENKYNKASKLKWRARAKKNGRRYTSKSQALKRRRELSGITQPRRRGCS